jgi:hypothetical protein
MLPARPLVPLLSCFVLVYHYHYPTLTLKIKISTVIAPQVRNISACDIHVEKTFLVAHKDFYRQEGVPFFFFSLSTTRLEV